MCELTLRVPPAWIDALDAQADQSFVSGHRQRSELIRQCIAIGAEQKGLILPAN